MKFRLIALAVLLLAVALAWVVAGGNMGTRSSQSTSDNNGLTINP